MSKQTDLREALWWCFQYRDSELDVIGPKLGPKKIKMDRDWQIHGIQVEGRWEPVLSWWRDLLDPDTRFQIPEEDTLPAEISKAIDSLDGICESGKKGVRKLVKEILEARK